MEEDYGTEDEKDFRKSFYQMTDKVENLFSYYQRRLEKNIRKQINTTGSTSRNKGNGGDHPCTPSSPFSSSSSSSSNKDSAITSLNAHKKNSENIDLNTPLLKFDIKYNLPMFNGENDAKKLDDWVRKIEVYCRIQKLSTNDI